MKHYYFLFAGLLFVSAKCMEQTKPFLTKPLTATTPSINDDLTKLRTSSGSGSGSTGSPLARLAEQESVDAELRIISC